MVSISMMLLQALVNKITLLNKLNHSIRGDFFLFLYYNIDMRNYKENPLKRGEIIPKEDLYDYYIMQNHSLKETLEHYNISKTIFRRQLKIHGIKKPKMLCKVHRDKTCLEKFGVKNIFEKVDYIKEKTKEKLGVENVAFLEETIEKRKNTCQEKYGGNAPVCSKEIADKIKKTNQERYGVDVPIWNENVKNKMKKKNLEKYGMKYSVESDIVKQHIKEGCLKKYGVENNMLKKDFKQKSKDTMLKLYGVEYAAQSEMFKEKVKQTCLKKYGKESYMQTKEFRDKSKKTNIEKYGVDHPNKNSEQLNKIFNTMRENGSYRKSKPEDKIYECLSQKFSYIERQYNKDPRYPFRCDFYIPELDLFIEYQGYQGHGKHPFNEQNEEDIKLLHYWEEKSRELKLNGERKTQYLDYIRTWTISDPIKRLYALENNLNWIEFFSFKDFMKWFNNF